MKRQYVGHVEITNSNTGEKVYRVYWLKPSRRGKGLEPVYKFAPGIGIYFPKMSKLPEGLEVGKTYDVEFDENGNIVDVKR